jgi:hypothetical protein
MISAAPEMLKVAKTIERVATAGVSVMLLGASGTGTTTGTATTGTTTTGTGDAEVHAARGAAREDC